jgi:pimeloyl-ACP methyl ester carboxylesterase
MFLKSLSRAALTLLGLGFVILGNALAQQPAVTDFAIPPKTYYRTAQVKGETMFYREAGDPSRPTIVLLHGYPSSSHTYRELIPMLSRHYRIIALDNLGSGYSSHPDPDETIYTFDRLADYAEGLIATLGITKYTLYMQDFGAPVGFRMIERNPDAITALIVQNANAYLNGLTPPRREFFRKAHEDRSPAHVARLYEFTSATAIKEKQYLRDVPKEKRDIMSPDGWTHDLAFLTTAKDRTIQLQLFQDYQTNIDRYPSWQALMREHQFPSLIVWGKNDPAFIAAGAEAYLRDLPKAELHLIDAGHFAVEEDAPQIARHILAFMARQ